MQKKKAVKPRTKSKLASLLLVVKTILILLQDPKVTSSSTLGPGEYKEYFILMGENISSAR